MSSTADSVTDRERLFRVVGDSMSVITDALGLLEPADRVVLIGSCRDSLDAAEATVVSEQLDNGSSDRQVEKLLGNGDRSSKKTVKRRARRGKAVNKNPDIATRMKSGGLSGEQADVIAAAAEKTDGAAAEDEDLIDEIAATSPDQGRRIADDWVREHTDASDVQDRYDRQRRLRCVKRWTTDRDTHVLAIEGDQAAIDKIDQSIRNRSKALYRADGGRDLPAGQHPRTRDQRNFDAAIALLTGTNPGGQKTNNGSGAKKAKDSAGPRSKVVVSMTLDQALGLDDSPVSQVGGGLIAPSLLSEMLCDADLVACVTDRFGLPLWLGRSTRFFTDEQVLALIIRDEGCVLCGARYSGCEAHHIIPSESPARGPTDIDNGALVCVDCHHQLHDNDLILVHDPTTGTWTTRAARPDEIAPQRSPALASGDAVGQRPPSAGRPSRTDSTRPEHRPPDITERTRTGALF